MELYIDSSKTDVITVGMDGERFTVRARQNKSQMLLPYIFKLLKKKNLTIEGINRIKVNTGPGSFTGLRVGVSVANSLGWLLGIPVNGKDIRKGEKIEIKYRE